MLTGTGSSKNVAKRQAAQKMWEKLSSPSMMHSSDASANNEVCA
jgi:dsRNA-specific ribonuclease